jgi:hypothetical protein
MSDRTIEFVCYREKEVNGLFIDGIVIRCSFGLFWITADGHSERTEISEAESIYTTRLN